MKKTYKLENLGCANCANLMAEDIKKLDGVKESKINYMLSELTVEVDDKENLPTVEELQKIIGSEEV